MTTLPPTPMSPDSFRRRTGVSRETLARLMAYGELLRRWQPAVNLVSRAGFADLWRRHMLDSAQLHPLIAAAPVRGGRRPVIVDLGSGAGFPGLVLAILGAGEVHLIEADRRKCAFLREVARATETPLTVHCERIERAAPLAADIVTARAVAPLPGLLSYAEPFLGPGAICLFLKGARWQEELTEAAKDWKMRVERVASVSEPSGMILRLGGVSRDGVGR